MCIDAVAAVSSDHTAVPGRGVFFDYIPEVTYWGTWLDNLSRFFEAFSCCFNYSDRIRVCCGFVSHVICFVQVGVVSAVVDRNIKIDDITIEEDSLIRNSVTYDFIYRSTE